MTFLEFVLEFKNWIGGGTAIGLLSAVLIYRSSKKGRDIDWYDRAINQVKDLDKEVMELKEIIRSLNSEVIFERTEKIKLQSVVEKLENIIFGLKAQLEDKKEDTKKKGVVDNEQT